MANEKWSEQGIATSVTNTMKICVITGDTPGAYANKLIKPSSLTLNGNYLPLSGGTISGSLNIDGLESTLSIINGEDIYFTVNKDVANSNLIGFGSGAGATGAHSSNFLGIDAGTDATNAYGSNFLGSQAGAGATDANSSNFFGANAGLSATDAPYSNFLGYNAGFLADSASYSTLIGYKAGYNATGSIGSNNIVIGTNVSLPNGTTNSMNLGGVLFGTGFYGTTSGNPLTGANSGGRIGIGTQTPTATLGVNGNAIFSNNITGSTDIIMPGLVTTNKSLKTLLDFFDISNGNVLVKTNLYGIGEITAYNSGAGVTGLTLMGDMNANLYNITGATKIKASILEATNSIIINNPTNSPQNINLGQGFFETTYSGATSQGSFKFGSDLLITGSTTANSTEIKLRDYSFKLNGTNLEIFYAAAKIAKITSAGDLYIKGTLYQNNPGGL